MKFINILTLVLVIVGGLNWGLVGLFDFDLVAAIFGAGSTLSRFVYILVGLSAARQIVTYRAEGGDLQGALRDARGFFEHFGPRAETHFPLSYVYRYGGLLEEAQRHCELAVDHDPQNPRLRSCGYAYLYGGNLARVMDFFKLDEGSYFSQWATVLYQLRRKDDAAAS